MYSKIQKWGNSQAIRLPKAILEKAQLKEHDKVELKVYNGMLMVLPIKRHKTLQERIAEYQGDYQCCECNAGNPVGNEEL